MSDDEWEDFVTYITPIIYKHESKFSKDNATSETDRVISKLKEIYLKTNESFRQPNGKFHALWSRYKRRIEDHPSKDIYIILQEFKLRLKSYRSISSEAVGKRKRRNLRKLDAHISKLNKMIQKLEEEELDLNDMNSDLSSYLHLDKVKRNLLKAWKKKCSLVQQPLSTGRPIDEEVTYAGSSYAGVNDRVSKFINSRHGCNFPNYRDILSIVRVANDEDHLGLESGAIEYEAKLVFKQVGLTLKKLRQKDQLLCTGSHITDQAINEPCDSPRSCDDSTPLYPEDPALYSPDLKNRLKENKHLGEAKMECLIEDFVKRQETRTENESCDSDVNEGEVCSYSESDKSDSSSLHTDADENEVEDDKSEGNGDENVLSNKDPDNGNKSSCEELEKHSIIDMNSETSPKLKEAEMEVRDDVCDDKVSLKSNISVENSNKIENGENENKITDTKTSTNAGSEPESSNKEAEEMTQREAEDNVTTSLPSSVLYSLETTIPTGDDECRSDSNVKPMDKDQKQKSETLQTIGQTNLSSVEINHSKPTKDNVSPKHSLESDEDDELQIVSVKISRKRTKGMPPSQIMSKSCRRNPSSNQPSSGISAASPAQLSKASQLLFRSPTSHAIEHSRNASSVKGCSSVTEIYKNFIYPTSSRSSSNDNSLIVENHSINSVGKRTTATINRRVNTGTPQPCQANEIIEID